MIGKSELYTLCEQCYLQPDRQEELIKEFLYRNELKYDPLMWIEFFNADSVVIKYDLIKPIIEEL